ncbi:hypothetical protein [Alicyclobacillus macrosporangiidus]|uniref:Uncharacterized protein n=1 Tax=Alicyclobacillus macrosporangiidus TaxID=392015 RepID=A0A1I7JAN5_9BACL|nr:hypothetical protein [Alicyclobacillus macrosporangiidus]SFU82235.1 hypothetical protein SAMN05421543_10953 [Alicyclobacillus macrosporangiidus]
MRRLEAGLVVAMATLTVMAAASVLTTGVPSSGRVDGMIRSGWNSMVRWMRAEPAVTPATQDTRGNVPAGPAAPAPGADSGDSVTGSGVDGGTTAGTGQAGDAEAAAGTGAGAVGTGVAGAGDEAGDASGDGTGGLGTLPGDGAGQAGALMWSSADIQALESILIRAAAQIQPADLQRLAGDLLSGDSAKAQSDFSAWAQSHLPEADRAWITEHFQGARAFDGSDVVLLQQAASQLWSELTPDEQALVASRVGDWLLPQGDAREGSGTLVSAETATGSGPSMGTRIYPE